MLLYGSANRDEREIRRRRRRVGDAQAAANILTLSHGAHLCLGAAAARMQSRVALAELMTRIPEFDVDEAGIV